MTRLSRFASSAVVLSALTLVMGPPKLSATVIATDVTYEFTGTCTDCTGFGIGYLTLQNYTLGNAFILANFVSFSYSSNLTSFSIPSSADVTVFSGSIPADLPAAAIVDIQDNSDPTNVLVTFEDTSWCAGSDCSLDQGPTSSFSVDPAPEPARLVLLGSAFLGLMLFRRRRTGRAESSATKLA